MCRKGAQQKALNMKTEEEKDEEKLISYVRDYYNLSPMDELKVVREPHHDFNKPKKTPSDL